MSPASKSKSKKLSSVRASKEREKVPSKSSDLLANGGKSAPSTPVHHAFHNMEISTSAPSLTLEKNPQSVTTDETEEHQPSSPSTVGDYDEVSNNGSSSGESEDQKEKTAPSATPRSDSICVPASDADRRNKIRQKNERKHQRQKEKRFRELHSRCSGYLKLKKVESLAQQLVAMGFPSDRSTVALIVNEGRLEDSVAWILREEGEINDNVLPSPEDGDSIKIDISDELAKIAALEMKYKCSKQDVERAVVASLGDLAKVEESLNAQKQEPAASGGNPKEEATGEPNGWSDKLRMAAAQNHLSSQGKGVASVINQQQQQNNGLHSLRDQQISDWLRTQVAAGEALDNNRWSRSNTPNPLMAHHPLGSIMQADSRYHLQPGFLRDAFILMQQHPQALLNARQSSSSTSVVIGSSPGFYANGIFGMDMVPLDSYFDYGSNIQSFREPSPSASSLVTPSSLGLFSGRGSRASSNSSVSWSSGGRSLQCDYMNIDWSLDLEQLMPPARGDWGSTWQPAVTSMHASRARWMPTVNGSYGPAMQPVGTLMVKPATAAAAPPAREWTSPFAGKDLLSIPRRQLVAIASI